MPTGGAVMFFNTSSPEIDVLLRDFMNDFIEAEQALKEVELLGAAGFNVASLDEIRYATYHQLQAMQRTDLLEIKSCFFQAKCHLRRALYDCKDAALLFYLEKCRQFRDAFGYFDLDLVLPHFDEQCNRLDAILQQVAGESRLLRSALSEECGNPPLEAKLQQLAEIKTIYEEWDGKRGQAARVVAASIKNDRRFYLSMALTILGLVVSLLGIALAI